MKTILTELHVLPPCACRLVARKRRGRRPLTCADIATISGLNVATVKRLSRRKDWLGVTVETAVRFALACGVNHLSRRRHMEFLKTGDFVHIRNAPPAQRKYLVEVLRVYNETLES